MTNEKALADFESHRRKWCERMAEKIDGHFINQYSVCIGLDRLIKALLAATALPAGAVPIKVTVGLDRGVHEWSSCGNPGPSKRDSHFSTAYVIALPIPPVPETEAVPCQ